MEIKFNNQKLVMYDTMQDLSSYRFHLYGLNVLIDAGIGSNPLDFYQRLGVLRSKIKVDPDGAIQEVSNISMTVQNILENLSPEMRSFVPWIKSINGRRIGNADLDESGINSLLKEINEIPMGKVWNFLDFIKKKSTRN